MPTTRSQKLKKLHRDEVRKKFKGNEYVRQLELCGDQLEELNASLKVATKKKLTAKDKITVMALNSQISCLELKLKIVKEKINLNLRRLRFVLPELKSVELTDPQGNNPFSGFIDSLKESLQKSA